jgi:hypothetical protein
VWRYLRLFSHRRLPLQVRSYMLCYLRLFSHRRLPLQVRSYMLCYMRLFSYRRLPLQTLRTLYASQNLFSFDFLERHGHMGDSTAFEAEFLRLTPDELDVSTVSVPASLSDLCFVQRWKAKAADQKALAGTAKAQALAKASSTRSSSTRRGGAFASAAARSWCFCSSYVDVY